MSNLGTRINIRREFLFLLIIVVFIFGVGVYYLGLFGALDYWAAGDKSKLFIFVLVSPIIIYGLYLDTKAAIAILP